MGSLDVGSAWSEQFERFDRIAENNPEFNPNDATVFTLFDRLHVLPARLRAFPGRRSPDPLVLRNLPLDLNHGLIDPTPAV